MSNLPPKEKRPLSEDDLKREASTGKNVPWYIPAIGPRLKPATMAFYKQYAGLEGEVLERHLYNIREQAWPLGRYPCVGNWGFLYAPIARSPGYQGALSRARKGGVVLDFGCGFGQDLRHMAADGVPSDQMWATDLNGDLWRMGYELLRDRGKFQAHFVQGDVFSPDIKLVEQLSGRVSVFLAYQFLHLFSWDNQIKLSEMMVAMSTPNAIILGSQMGCVEAWQQKTPWGEMFFHNNESWGKLWKAVEENTGTRWRVTHSRLVDLGEWGLQPEDYSWVDQRKRAFDFVVERVEEAGDTSTSVL